MLSALAFEKRLSTFFMPGVFILIVFWLRDYNEGLGELEYLNYICVRSQCIKADRPALYVRY